MSEGRSGSQDELSIEEFSRLAEPWREEFVDIDPGGICGAPAWNAEETLPTEPPRWLDEKTALEAVGFGESVFVLRMDEFLADAAADVAGTDETAAAGWTLVIDGWSKASSA